jgi:hypothetical protein
MGSEKSPLHSRIRVQNKETSHTTGNDMLVDTDADSNSNLFTENVGWNDDNYDDYESAEHIQTNDTPAEDHHFAEISHIVLEDANMMGHKPIETISLSHGASSDSTKDKDNVVTSGREKIPLAFFKMTKAERGLHVKFSKMRTVCQYRRYCIFRWLITT